jgi:hypothetical protein
MWSMLLLLITVGFISACNSSEEPPSLPEGLRTWLLVGEPGVPLPAGRPVEVKSRSEDFQHGVSHVELYAVQLPNGRSNVLIRSDAVPFAQTGYTASQIFTPRQPGHYVIKVVGYNTIGQKAESEYISFDVN